MPAKLIPLEKFFAGHDQARVLFEAVSRVIDSIGEADMRVTNSQIAFSRRIGIAWVWMPAMYLRGKIAPLVLSVALPFRDASPRWKQIVLPHPGRYMHHLELRDVSEVDDEVRRWLQIAWLDAG